MHHIHNRLLLLGALLIAICEQSIAQDATPTPWNAAKEHWENATELWEHEKYSNALFSYEEWLAEQTDLTSTQCALAFYRVAFCSIQLQQADAANRVENFLSDYPENPLGQKIQWELANYFYRKRDWNDAIDAFNGLNPLRMKPDEKLEKKFKRGHAHFELEQFEEARLDLFTVMEGGADAGEYQMPAKYYFSHISYLKGQPQVALEGFQSLESEPRFQQLVPIYIAQLLHETEQYQALIDYAPKVVNPNFEIREAQRADVARLVGDALYRLRKFDEALPYLEEAYHYSRGRDRTRAFSYQMGFTYYRAAAYGKALNCFSIVVREQDEMGQLALYHMADSYLGLGERDKARTTFKKTSELDFDAEVSEDALFSYAKLAYELTYNPFDDAITAIERYLREYPESKRRDEAYGFLLEVYMSSKDYDRALEALSLIEDKSPKIQTAYQLVSYNRGVELFRSGSYADAHAYFERVREYPVDRLMTAESYFWQGELSYLLRKFKQATAYYAQFESSPGAYQSAHYNDGIYARGYALFKRKKYVDALSAFRSYLKQVGESNTEKTRDAKLRVGDCYYASKDFESAARFYSEVISASENHEDYARFQRADCFGSLNRKADEIDALQELIALAPASSYAPEALYALGRACIETNQLDLSKTVLEQLRSDFPNSPRTKYALVDLCLIGVKQDRAEDVLQLWDVVRSEYGQDPIAGDAFNVVEPILIDRGLLDDLPPGVGLDGDQIEERFFNAARNFALERNCEKAMLRLSEYIRNYDQGRFLAEAHFFLGNCAYDLKDVEEARRAFEYVLQQPVSDFTEPAALGAATIAWNAQDVSSALAHYQELEAVSVLKENKLEARIGLMRCYFSLESFDQAKAYADQVISDNQTPEDIRRTARYWKAKINFANAQFDAAQADLMHIASFGGERGAECAYLLCTYPYRDQSYKETESQIFQLIDQFAAFDTWKRKAFLLLIDAYIGMEDWFQAKTTGESILEFVQDPATRAEAEKRLIEIKRLEDAAMMINVSADSTSTEEITPEAP
ncbi:tetratricopeptide repeat protein [Flavobacteriales bacterium]|nr:tetratricopeptide repeat protein [Flavobacteriales bacterium]